MSPDAIVWRCLWTRAFPTLSPTLLESDKYNNGNLWEQYLAWRTISSCCRNKDSYAQSVNEETWTDSHVHKWHESRGYREITPGAVLEIFDRIRTIKGEKVKWNETIITDLGSGRGIVLLVILTAYCASKLVGIELEPSLHLEALQNYALWMVANQDMPRRVDVEWRHGDFTTDTDWVASSNVIICHATVFEDALISRLTDLCILCQSGTVFVMVSRPLQHSSIVTIESLHLEMSWGSSTVYLQTKL